MIPVRSRKPLISTTPAIASPSQPAAFPKVKPTVVPGLARSAFAARHGAPKPPTVTFDTMAQRHTNAG